MFFLFWVCLVLLALGALGGFALPATNRPYIYAGSGVLVVICLLCLGLKVMGAPH